MAIQDIRGMRSLALLALGGNAIMLPFFTLLMSRVLAHARLSPSHPLVCVPPTDLTMSSCLSAVGSLIAG